MAETSINYLTEDGHAVISTDERKWVNKINSLKEEYPDEVEIRSVFKDGTVVAHIPKGWVRVKPPVKRVLTDEQKRKAAERMAMLRAMRKGEEVVDEMEGDMEEDGDEDEVD